MTERDFKEAIGEARAELDRAQLPPMADRRLKARLFHGAAPAQKRRTRPMRLALSAVGLVVLVAVGTLWVTRSEAQRPAGFETLSASSDFRHSIGEGGTVHVASGQAVLVEPERGVTLSVDGPAVVAREADGVRIARGKVELSVRKRPKDQGPVRVRVSAGSIEVFGTRFTVIERGNGGEVQLHEGSIGFRPDRGELVMLVPGERLEWPLAVQREAAEVAPEPAPDGRPTRLLSRREETVKTDALLREVASLRTRGRYREAAQLLERGLTWRLRPASRELLSYELGAILTWQLRDEAGACAHWGRHQRSYSGKRFVREIARARATLNCPR